MAMASKSKDSPEQVTLYKDLAVVLYRAGKSDPETPEEREWKDARPDYLKRGRRLAKALERHGYTLTKEEPEANDGEDSEA